MTVEEIARAIEARVPGSRARVDIGEVVDWIDVVTSTSSLAIECRKDDGRFGVSLRPFDGFGSGPDEIFDSVDSLLVGVTRLMGIALEAAH